MRLRIIKNRKWPIFGLTILLLSSQAYGDVTQIARFLTVANKPLHAQENLLSQTREVEFPDSVTTIKEAINYLLSFSGYSLATPDVDDESVLAIFNTSLPDVDRNFGPISLLDGLSTLVGQAFFVLDDPVHRKIFFHLKPDYQKIYQKKDNTKI